MDGNNANKILHLRKCGSVCQVHANAVTKKEWTHVMAPVLLSGLPHAAGLDRNFPRDVFCGLDCVQGLGITCPWHCQGITHLLVCLNQTQLGGITGCLISPDLEELSLEVGLPGWLTDRMFAAF
jgi:hypothetical protein